MKKRGFDGRMRRDLKGVFCVQQADQLNESRGETLDRLEQARAVNRAAFAEEAKSRTTTVLIHDEKTAECNDVIR